ncbi:MAG: sodium:calcium antiporter [Chloroflexi bacterium]|nr:sodium:calcium antiporter [Chloroflexota bacterium]
MSDDKPNHQIAPVDHARNWLQIGGAAAVAAPAPVIRTLDIAGAIDFHLDPAIEALIFGVSIMAAATLLIWASEVAEQLVSATLALAVLAIIAVLPEYAVDVYFAWTGGSEIGLDPSLRPPGETPAVELALANMTGANRLLIGLAWPVVFLLFWLKTRKKNLAVGSSNSVGLIFLGIATIYSFSIPLRGGLSLIDSAVLISLFAAYLVLSSRSPPSEHELIGPAETIAALSPNMRWAAVIAMFAYAAGVVIAAAEPFANGLVESGESLGIEEFLLVQWVAPLASEAPEFMLAAMLALRGRAGAAMTLLISSKVNQWTLLVGSLPIAYSISGTTFSPLPVDGRQAEEVFLTAGQSIFAVAVLASLSFSRREAILIFVLFATQLAIPIPEVRIGFGALYITLALIWFVSERRDLPVLLRHARTTIQGAETGAAGSEERRQL